MLGRDHSRGGASQVLQLRVGPGRDPGGGELSLSVGGQQMQEPAAQAAELKQNRQAWDGPIQQLGARALGRGTVT